jgi:hypothetical protein
MFGTTPGPSQPHIYKTLLPFTQISSFLRIHGVELRHRRTFMFRGSGPIEGTSIHLYSFDNSINLEVQKVRNFMDRCKEKQTNQSTALPLSFYTYIYT